MFDEEGRLRVALGSTEKGSSALAFKDANDKQRAAFTVGSNGGPGMIMGDGQETRIALGVNRGFAAFALRDADEKNFLGLAKTIVSDWEDYETSAYLRTHGHEKELFKTCFGVMRYN